MTLDQIRESIWNEIGSVDELMQHEIFKELHVLYQEMEASPLMFPMEETRIMNEAGVAVEWLRFCHNLYSQDYLEQLVREVYADMGLKDHADAVLSLVYAIVGIVNWPAIEINKATRNELSKMNKDSWCGGHVNRFIQHINKEGKLLAFPFNRAEESVKEIRKLAKELQTTVTDGINKVFQNYSTVTEITEKSDGNGKRVLTINADIDIKSGGKKEERGRKFTLDEIINYAKECLSLDASQTVQNMLYRLLSEDGTEEERAKVASIPNAIMKRSAQPQVIGQVIGRQSNIGDVSGLEALMQSDDIKKLLGKL